MTTDQCIPSDNVTCYVIFLNKCKNCRGNIDVNAAVAEVATPNIWPAGVVLCWWPPIFWQVFYFFPSAKFLNTASRCHFHLQCAQCTVFNSTDEQNSLQIHTFSGKGHSSSPDPTSIAAYGASILSLRHSTCDPPNVPVALTPMRGKPVFNTVTVDVSMLTYLCVFLVVGRSQMAVLTH